MDKLPTLITKEYILDNGIGASGLVVPCDKIRIELQGHDRVTIEFVTCEDNVAACISVRNIRIGQRIQLSGVTSLIQVKAVGFSQVSAENGDDIGL